MSSAGPLIVLFIIILCFAVGVGALLAGCYGNKWITNDAGSINEGLWETCNVVFVKVCSKRGSLFKFEDAVGNGVEKDIILLLLLSSALSAFLALIFSISMTCCLKRLSAWKCTAGIAFVFGIIASIAGFAGLGYSEKVFKNAWSSDFRHGWSSIICWVASTLNFLGALLSCLVIPYSPPNYQPKINTRVGKPNPTFHGDNHW
ncbi:uncharacterized protein LOC101239340 [Hydra vulgaris]|uniref:uncharacterized protein LOC101239340 n=1 Tax=Hydra vulgaris TaxID=6087 RepID=UPI001F5F024C|nr:uncharacterized protein LOC101239340 [Hydra vulgaris]XP_047138011.1 uncharacterized protein LOC101239340 [Hydra vulgaris]